ncbi:MAG: peroxiredoxin-like family protein [Chloroflexi bacterium]|nr:peroxiredoxin-like family protein [Chloroflexota bacterium]MDA1240537.1 peroxiredoxin-like family protein [Chloroflexota bacterium]
METLDQATSELEILTPDGESVRLGSVWAERPVVVVLLRHFGCMFCKQHVARIRDVLADVRALGAEVAVIGNGTPFMAQAFVEDYAFEVPVFTNPGRDVYRALGAKRPSSAFILRPSFWINSFRAFRAGFRQGALQGDRAQLGGVFIVLPGGAMPFAHRSAVAGDIPSNARVLQELRSALAPAR